MFTSVVNRFAVELMQHKFQNMNLTRKYNTIEGSGYSSRRHQHLCSRSRLLLALITWQNEKLNRISGLIPFTSIPSIPRTCTCTYQTADCNMWHWSRRVHLVADENYFSRQQVVLQTISTVRVRCHVQITHYLSRTY